MKPLSQRWNQLASRLGTSPRQLVFLVASAVIAVVILGSKMLIEPKSASATTMQPASIIKVPEPTAVPIPELFFKAAPHWNLATSPARSPFTSPEDLRPRTVVDSNAVGTAPDVQLDLVLQATMDHTFAVINGDTFQVGQSWIDPKTKQAMQLIEVGDRNARLSMSGHMIELTLGQ